MASRNLILRFLILSFAECFHLKASIKILKIVYIGGLHPDFQKFQVIVWVLVGVLQNCKKPLKSVILG